MPRRPEERSPAEVIADECIAVRVRALNRAITGLYDDALRPLGLRIGQLNLLVAIARMGTARPSDLCRILQMDKSTLSRDVEVIRRKGWLLVEEGAGRARPLRISPGGLSLLERAFPAWRQAQEQAGTLIGDEGAASLRQMSLRLRKGDLPGL
jgi:DNA-binding MarR family transcriptional regulator